MHESSGVIPQTCAHGFAHDLDQPATPREKGATPARPAQLVVDAVFAQDGLESLFERVAAAHRRIAEIEASSSVPGITLVAPVPAWILDTCQVVGGKYSLPSSQRIAANSAMAGAAM